MKKTGGIFITGTDTGVGKTFFSAVLLRACLALGIDAVYMKPVQTGCKLKSRRLIASDCEFVLSFAGLRAPLRERKYITPYLFRKACSPHLAAAIEKRNIRLSKITGAFRQLRKRHGLVIVEGAGGILTPLSWKTSMLDLAKALALPVILVARPGLGTINHTILSLRELKRAKLPVLGVVLNNAAGDKKGPIEKSNRVSIEKIGRVRVLAEVPHVRGLRRGGSQITSAPAMRTRAAGVRRD